MVSRRSVLKAGAASVAALGLVGPVAATGHGVTSETEDVFGQGPSGSVVAPGGATIKRTAKGISMNVSMPTPDSGEYQYPESGVYAGAGHPEAFSLWAFVFNDPASEDWDGAFFVAGHVVGGSTLNLSGRVSTNSEPFAGEPLDNPEGAEVHLAVAPHGALDPELMPEQIKTPTGPGPTIWWLALFE